MYSTVHPSAKELACAAGVSLTTPTRAPERNATSVDGRYRENGEPRYAIVGNGETTGLIGRDLAIAWLCLPHCRGRRFFTNAFDPARGGRLTIRAGTTPFGGAGQGNGSLRAAQDGHELQLNQSYLGRTNLLATTAQNRRWQLRSIDSMPWGQRILLRRFTMSNLGASRKRCYLAFGIEPTRSSPPLTITSTSQVSGESTVVLVDGGSAALAVGWISALADLPTERWPRIDPHKPATTGSLLVGPPLVTGERWNVTLLLAYGDGRDDALQRWKHTARHLAHQLPGDPQGLLEERMFWTNWLAGIDPPAFEQPHAVEVYYRTQLTRKILAYPEG